MSMAGTIEDMRWEIKQQKKEIDLLSKQVRKKDKEIDTLKKFITEHKLIRDLDEDERKRAQERMIANGTSTY
jgi:ribosomal protein S18